jgi:hypothetical protein
MQGDAKIVWLAFQTLPDVEDFEVSLESSAEIVTSIENVG